MLLIPREIVTREYWAFAIRVLFRGSCIYCCGSLAYRYIRCSCAVRQAAVIHFKRGMVIKQANRAHYACGFGDCIVPVVIKAQIDVFLVLYHPLITADYIYEFAHVMVESELVIHGAEHLCFFVRNICCYLISKYPRRYFCIVTASIFVTPFPSMSAR